MSVHDAEPNDIYADEQGKLWRIIGVCHQPTVIAEEVEGTLNDPNAPRHDFAVHPGGLSSIGQTLMPRASIIKARKSGGVGGLMWKGWKRIWRKEGSAER